MKAPFWYVVKHKDGGYVGPYVDKHVEHQREARRHLAPLRAAAVAATWWPEGSHRVVRVWARLPKPRLPQWVDPTPLDAGEVEVWRSHSVTATRYVFAVERGLLCPQRFVHYIRTPDGQKAKPIGLQAMISMPPDVWIEAGLRAAAMLRKAKK